MKQVSKLSLFAFIDSVLSLLFLALSFVSVCYSQYTTYYICYYIWIITGLCSPFIPLLAKRYRLRHGIDNHINRPLEIVALIIALFSFHSICYIALNLSSNVVIASALLAICMVSYWGMKGPSIDVEKAAPVNLDPHAHIDINVPSEFEIPISSLQPVKPRNRITEKSSIIFLIVLLIITIIIAVTYNR